MYRNTLYWDAALKPKYLGISACIKHAFRPFLDYGFNAAFNIEILDKKNKNLVNILKYRK